MQRIQSNLSVIQTKLEHEPEWIEIKDWQKDFKYANGDRSYNQSVKVARKRKRAPLLSPTQKVC
jgi:hypothetical protein